MCFHQAQPQRRSSSLTSCHTHIWQNFLLEDCSSMVRDISAIAWAAGLSQGTAKSGLGLGSRALQKGAEGCVGGPGALLLGCEKWECFIHSRWKYRQRYYLTFVFFVVLTNNFKCSYHVVSMYRHFISGGLLSSQLCKHRPHKSPQPTHLPLTQHSHNEKELNESSFSNRCTQPGP